MYSKGGFACLFLTNDSAVSPPRERKEDLLNSTIDLNLIVE